MSMEKINEAYEKLRTATEWKSILVEYKHTTRPGQFRCYTFSFAQSRQAKELPIALFDTFNAIIQKNGFEVKPYTASNEKNVIEKIDTSNLLISTNWSNFIGSINVSDDTTKLEKIKPDAYVFIGTYKDENNTPQNIYLITKKNPILNFKKKKLYTGGRGNSIEIATEPILQFANTFDCVVYENVLYSLNLNFETIFNLEHTRKILTNQSLGKIDNLSIVNNIGKIREFAIKGQTPKKFITFSDTRLKYLQDMEKRSIIAQMLGLELDTDGKIKIVEDAHCIILIKYLCNKTARDMIDETVLEASQFTPLNH